LAADMNFMGTNKSYGAAALCCTSEKEAVHNSVHYTKRERTIRWQYRMLNYHLYLKAAPQALLIEHSCYPGKVVCAELSLAQEQRSPLHDVIEAMITVTTEVKHLFCIKCGGTAS